MKHKENALANTKPWIKIIITSRSVMTKKCHCKQMREILVQAMHKKDEMLKE